MKTSLRLKPRKHNGSAHLMVLPSYLAYFIFVFLPVILTLSISFTNYDLAGSSDFIGLKNFIRLFDDVIFLISVRNTFVYALLTIVPQLSIGLLLAVALNRPLPGQRFLRVSFYVPYLVSMVSVSMLWLWMYDPSFGVLNTIFRAFGFPSVRWLFNEDLALFSIIIMGIWKAVGYNMLIYLAGLQQIPDELYEAAEIDGATSVHKFLSITFPLLAPTTFFLFVVATIQSFSVFEQVNVMTGGGPGNATTTMVHQIYERAFTDLQMGYACSMGVILLIITLILTFVNFRYGKQGKDIEIG